LSAGKKKKRRPAAAFSHDASYVLLDRELLRSGRRFFGSVSSSTPSAYFALARASSISWLSRKARDTLPKLAFAVQHAFAVFFIALGARLGRDRHLVAFDVDLDVSFLTPGSSGPPCIRRSARTSTFMRRTDCRRFETDRP